MKLLTRKKPVSVVEHIQCGSLSAKLIRKKIKNLHLRVCPPDGSIQITAPLKMEQHIIDEFVTAKLDWIQQKQTKIQKQHQASQREYINNELHYLWGKPYVLQLIESPQLSTIQLQQDCLYLYVPQGASLEKKSALFEAWYRQQLEPVIARLIAKWEPVMKVKVQQFFIQRMKTRWGSCNIRTKNIRINTELAKKPVEYLEYIVIHELVHLLEPSHNYRFKAFMDTFLPQWRTYQKNLNDGV